MKIVNILPRQSKKTIIVLDLLSKNLEQGVVVVPTERYKHDMIRTFDATLSFIDGHRIREKIITPNQFNTWFISRRVNIIIFDEYFHIDYQNLIRIRENLQFVNGGAQDPVVDIIAFGTMQDQIDMNFINAIKEQKAIGGQLEDIYEDLINIEERKIRYWYHNFITDLDCTIVIGPGKTDYMDSPHYLTDSLNLPFK